MVKKTFKELNEVDSLIGELYQKNPKLKESKFGYAYKRFIDKNFIEHLKEYQHQLSDVRIDNAMEDKDTKEILKDPTPGSRGFKYTKEGLKKVIEQENEIMKKWNEKEIEVEPYIITAENLPILSEGQREQLSGILVESTNGDQSEN